MMENEITGSQVRAARAYLRWSMAVLAERADVGISTIQQIENFDGSAYIHSDQQWRIDARAEAADKIRHALELGGIKFLDEVRNRTAQRGPGIRGPMQHG
ncbi:helix-turn-helix transcriptional regulator [Tardiphaga sp.]|uniref:helix-turn-helix transcriptional regulator n=1 Tax=Tardiphaga sp. TaxID=1926292 RepID=UPI002619B2AD|nr:helix-turn-helix transcriptional regulator [Tardiphaga sp.]MDB5615927.1 helix-turn-helix protein [Tardiphaga sp.]